MSRSCDCTMKVCLDFGLTKPHTLYDELINYPPKRVEYQISARKLSSSSLYNVFRSFYEHHSFAKIKPVIREAYFSLLKAYFGVSKDARIDLIHVCNGFIPRNAPWVVDLDEISSFVGLNMQILRFHKKNIERELSSRYCRKIMPWTRAGAKTLEKFLDTRNFKDKIEVVHPAMHVIPRNRKQRDGKIRLLFVGSITNPETFIRRGGNYALECFKILSKKYDVELLVRSTVPNEIRKKYQDLENLIFVENPLPKDELFNLYLESDISLLPGHVYPLMATLESMACGLPVVTINGWANSEFVDHEITGFLVEPAKKVIMGMPPARIPGFLESLGIVNSRVRDALVKYLSILIEDDSLRKKMGKNARKRIKNGDLSIRVRNQKLGEIYKEAVEK